ncbi:carboxyphosphonoenolpyruvate phosphonomutase-like protein [Penicillium brasilianum]|uniref:Carboxyphosphonoenolpyruvate phosphonomutase-like protein n=1 Tax=Penicillium brasilianum TaxID=104259 RepID=A0A1S9RXE1_PENBI|nr:carboxyphosphonoenolpyruvate phosphonomutase-like protein [Penicillium brasilianum]
MTTQNDIAKHFRTLHNPQDPLILTNIYDASSASVIASLPTTRAIATASFAVAATLGVDDEDLTKAQNLSALKTIASTVRRINPTLPVTVDLQDGYGNDLPALAATIKEAIALGAVGCNIEDMDNAAGTLRPLDEAVARVRTVVEAAREAGCPDFALNARTDVLFQDGKTLEDALERGRAFLEAGAWTVFVWGGPGGRGVSREEVQVLVRELQGRVNVKMNLREGFLGVEEIRELGVARVSLGPELWKCAMKAVKEQAELLLK